MMSIGVDLQIIFFILEDQKMHILPLIKARQEQERWEMDLEVEIGEDQ
jgi:hypothetical protein